MTRFLVLLVLLFPSVGWAASEAGTMPEPDAAVSALTNMEGRYTIGPWEGSLQGGRCVLTNSEPLAFADFELGAQQGQANVTLHLMPVVPVRATSSETMAAQVDAHEKAELVYRADEGGFGMNLPQALLEQMTKGSFFTVGSYKYDLRGFAQSYKLLQDCMNKAIPASLPYEPLAESDAVEVAAGWQMITLKLGHYNYARYAMFGASELGLWVHNVDDFVLSLTGLDEAAAGTVTLNGVAYATVPQKGGILVPLTPEQVRAFEEAKTLTVKFGSFEKSFDIKGFRAVVTALQPYE